MGVSGPERRFRWAAKSPLQFPTRPWPACRSRLLAILVSHRFLPVAPLRAPTRAPWPRSAHTACSASVTTSRIAVRHVSPTARLRTFTTPVPAAAATQSSWALAQQVTNPDWALPSDNNGVLIQLPSVPSGGTTTVNGNLIFGIGTQTNNGLGAATVFDVDNNPSDTTYTFFTTVFNGQTNSCSYIDSGSNAYFFPSAGYPGLVTCGRPELSILLSGEFADTECKQSGSVGQWEPERCHSTSTTRTRCLATIMA